MKLTRKILGYTIGVPIVALALADALGAAVLDRMARIAGELSAAVGNEVDGWWESYTSDPLASEPDDGWEPGQIFDRAISDDDAVDAWFGDA